MALEGVVAPTPGPGRAKAGDSERATEALAVMLAKTFKGLTDAICLPGKQSASLDLLRVTRVGTPRVRRELLVEVAFNEVQESPQYPAGLALRFVRVKLHRPDKSPVDCDTIKTVKAIFQRKIGVA